MIQLAVRYEYIVHPLTVRLETFHTGRRGTSAYAAHVLPLDEKNTEMGYELRVHRVHTY